MKELKVAPAESPVQPRFAYDRLDPVIHERARLSLLTSLATHPKGLSFAELKSLCALTDGNLNRHLQVLQAAGVVGITKALNRSRMQTSCHITAVGHRRYMEYLAVIEQVLIDSGKTVDEHLDLRGHRPAVRFSEG